MFFSVDLLVLVILRMLDTTLFSGANVTIGSSAGFFAIDACLPTLEGRGFFLGEFARLDALLNAALLIDIALHI